MANTAGTDVLIIGAGVSGLTTAVVLVESGLTVRVLARERPLATTSAVAGASWGPYLVSDRRVLQWSGQTLTALEAIARDEGSGVRLIHGMEAAPYDLAPPGWAREVHGFRMCEADELPEGYVSGWRYRIPLADMPRYLTYLERRLADRGVTIDTATVGSLNDVAGAGSVVVNCTGLGARVLVPDDEVSPTRGQLVVVENPGLDWFFQDHAEGSDLTYFLPHDDYVVLGGSAIPGATNMAVNHADAERIIARCVAVEPILAKAKVLGHRIGLRPARSLVRVERVDMAGQPVIHNYGHGGAGLTLSWGCAFQVLEEIRQI
jgi:D-amino-acid oxidase